MADVFSVVTQNFTCAGQPTIVTAKKGVLATDIQGDHFILWRQENFPQGNQWSNIQKIVFPQVAITGSISAGTTQGTLGQVVFSNSNNVSFGMSGQTVTASASLPVGAAGSISAGTTRGTLGEVVFSNSNGITFGMGGQTVTASYTVPSTAGLLSNINVSAGTTSNLASAFTFSNSNGLAFGLNAGTITGSYTVPTVTNSSASISAGTQSTILSSLVFSNSNGLAFGLSNNTITGSYTVPTVTNSSATISAGTASQTLNSLVFSDFNGIGFGLSASTITASYTVPSTAGLISAINVSASGTNNNLTNLVFSNSNNVTFGMSGSTITATISVAAGAKQTIGMSNLGNTSGTTGDAVNAAVQYVFAGGNNITLSQSLGVGSTAGTLTVSGVLYSNANNVSFGLNAGTLTASATVASTQGSIVLSAGATSNTGSQFVFSNSNNVSFGLSGSTITGTVTVASTQGSIVLSAGATSNTGSQFVFSNSNNVSFGLNGSTITGTVTVASTQGSIVLSAGATSNTGSQFVFSNSNNVSFGLSGSTVTASATAASTQGSINISAGVTSNLASAFTFSNSNNITFGLSASTITASYAPPFISSYENSPNGLFASQTMTFNGISVSHAVNFLMPEPISASFIRLPVLMSASTGSIAANASITTAMGFKYSTWNAVAYSLGTGASSLSLVSFASSQGLWTLVNSVSAGGAGNSTRYSITQAFTVNSGGANITAGTSSQYSQSNAAATLSSGLFTNFSSLRWLDIDFARTLSAGAYWLIVGLSSSSTTSGQGASAMTNAGIYYSNHYGNSQINSWFELMAATAGSSGGYLGAGSFSTAGGGTTSILPISAISSSLSNNKLYFQIQRNA